MAIPRGGFPLWQGRMSICTLRLVFIFHSFFGPVNCTPIWRHILKCDFPQRVFPAFRAQGGVFIQTMFSRTVTRLRRARAFSSTDNIVFLLENVKNGTIAVEDAALSIKRVEVQPCPLITFHAYQLQYERSH